MFINSEPLTKKINKRPAWGYFSGDDVELFEDEELEINNNGMPSNKIHGIYLKYLEFII